MQSKLYDEVVSAIVKRARAVSVGDPSRRSGESPGPCMGPLVSRGQRDKVLGYVSKVREEGDAPKLR